MLIKCHICRHYRNHENILFGSTKYLIIIRCHFLYFPELKWGNAITYTKNDIKFCSFFFYSAWGCIIKMVWIPRKFHSCSHILNKTWANNNKQQTTNKTKQKWNWIIDITQRLSFCTSLFWNILDLSEIITDNHNGTL